MAALAWSCHLLPHMQEETIYSVEYNRPQEQTLQNTALLLALLFKKSLLSSLRGMLGANSRHSTPGHCDVGRKAKAQDKSPREKLGILGCDLLRLTSEE